MEPMNCTAQVKARKVEIWVPTQVQQFACMVVANVAGVATEDVTIHVTLLGGALPAGRARGVALQESFGTIVAQVAEVSINDGKPRVHKVVCAVDCGTVVNPDTVKKQMQSSVVFALSAALYGKVDIQGGVVQQTNFPNYTMVKMAQSPVVGVYIVPSQRAPAGVGEPGVPPLVQRWPTLCLR